MMDGAAVGLANFLPAIIFLVACALAFATGTSWGHIRHSDPHRRQEIFASNPDFLIIGIAACLARRGLRRPLLADFRIRRLWLLRADSATISITYRRSCLRNHGCRYFVCHICDCWVYAESLYSSGNRYCADRRDVVRTEEITGKKSASVKKTRYFIWPVRS